MDPNATLEKMRRLLAEREDGQWQDYDDADMFADAFESLDTWLTNNGFPPRDWIGGSPVA